MAVVTALRATRGGRVAVHLDNAYFCTVSGARLAALRIHQGLELDDQQAAELLAGAEAERALADAYRLLGQRARAVAELAGRLRAKGHTEECVQAALRRLTDEGLLDDAAFARSFAADKMRLNGWGRVRIVRELERLGVPTQLAQQAAGSVQTEDEPQRAAAALRARGAPRSPLEAEKRRAYQFLLRRGYDPHVAYEAVRGWAATATRAEDE